MPASAIFYHALPELPEGGVGDWDPAPLRHLASCGYLLYQSFLIYLPFLRVLSFPPSSSLFCVEV